MNQTSFEVGSRVRHKVTRIEGSIVQIEESLAMPHVWVLEPSEREVNPYKLYRLIDLEKVEDSGEKANNQAQDLNSNILRTNQSAAADSSTLKDFPCESVLTVEEDITTVSTEVESPVLTVEPELITLCSESVSGEQIASKLLPINVRSSSNTINNTSTTNELLRDKNTDLAGISLSKNEAGAEGDLTSNELLGDQGTDLAGISLSNQEPEADDLTSKESSRDKSDQEADLSPSKTRRYKGHGSGTISWRTLTRNGRDYYQPWYQYEFWDKGKCTLKSSKYIPKKLLQQVQQMNQAKVPVLEILEVLGVFRK